MDFGTNSRKRTLSATESTSLASQKRARASPTKPSKPILRVDCAVAPQRPKPQPFLSPLPFSIDSSTTFTSSAQSAHTSARVYQHQSSSQVYDCHQTYNYQPQSYAQPPSRSPAAPYWPGFSGYQPAGTPSREAYGGYSFADMCQTSVSCSIYSSFSNGSEHVGNFTSAARTNEPTVLPNQSGDTRNAFIDALVSCLLKVKETLAAQQGSIDEMLQLTALLGNHQ
ncbi:hypothetical protein T440DRAFT_484439 [Plenodomus tracheiphilus IPT5]|uniref:Uncharacterized protein n=1 Tax=Plenodomus tracheiphilus IPT5 TaxID=1408161 RepID=A0A6A7APL2_9PLEO|nr:hypothetical protein T440DRAFT_484439 [Plenodomus tracheiphilus IPT5]